MESLKAKMQQKDRWIDERVGYVNVHDEFSKPPGIRRDSTTTLVHEI